MTIYNYYGDLLIYYNGGSEDSGDYVDCWCSRWDIQNYDIIIETWIKKDDVQTLQDNIRPGAVGELYTILGKPLYYDKSWDGSNTLRLKPNYHKSRNTVTGLYSGEYPTEIPNMRSEKLIYVSNITSTPLEGNKEWINVKIEGKISGSCL